MTSQMGMGMMGAGMMGTGMMGTGMMGMGLESLPEELQKVIIDAMMAAKPQRATDIFYEDANNIFIMRQGQQFQLRPPHSFVWNELGTGTTAEIMERVAQKMKAENDERMKMQMITFLLAAEEAKLLVIFPPERHERRTKGENE